MNLFKGIYIFSSKEVKRQYYNHICVFLVRGWGRHVKEDWLCSYWAITSIYPSPWAVSLWVTSLSLHSPSPLPPLDFVLSRSPPFPACSQTCPTDDFTGWTPSCTCCPAWISMVTTAKCCSPRITTWAIPLPSLSLRYSSWELRFKCKESDQAVMPELWSGAYSCFCNMHFWKCAVFCFVSNLLGKF